MCEHNHVKDFPIWHLCPSNNMTETIWMQLPSSTIRCYMVKMTNQVPKIRKQREKNVSDIQWLLWASLCASIYFEVFFRRHTSPVDQSINYPTSEYRQEIIRHYVLVHTKLSSVKINISYANHRFTLMLKTALLRRQWPSTICAFTSHKSNKRKLLIDRQSQFIELLRINKHAKWKKLKQ